MKNTIRLIGIIAIVALIGFSMAACGDDGDSSSPKHTHTWSEWTDKSPATCIAAKVQERSCTCEAKQTQNVGSPDPTAHTADIETGLCTLCSALTYNIGDTGPGGGKIFYRNETAFGTNWHYLEAAPNNQGTGVKWSNTPVDVTSATATTIGTGKANTDAIIAAHPSDTISNNAAKAANITIGSKNDWFLPSKDELNELYEQRSIFGITTGYFWSSSQGNNRYNAWAQNFNGGSQMDNIGKIYDGIIVRAIRAF